MSSSKFVRHAKGQHCFAGGGIMSDVTDQRPKSRVLHADM